MLIIGGSDAGISAGLRIAELQPEVAIDLLVADAYPNFSICGLPFFISGEVPDWKQLAHRSSKDLEEAGLHVHTHTRALAIDPQKRRVQAERPEGQHSFGYDRLLLATGAISRKPPITGLENPGVFFLRWMDESLEMKEFIRTQHPKKAVIIGAGYIGMEMADALSHLGIEVSVVEFSDFVLSTVDPWIGKKVEHYLKEKGIKVFTQSRVAEILQQEGGLQIKGSPELSLHADMVLVATGSSPNTGLAGEMGMSLGRMGAIEVNQRMETELPEIYAAGDCVETYHRLLGKYTYLPLGSTAHKQGRVAGENMVGGSRQFEGSMGTQVVKIFDRVIGRTGLKDQEAQSEGFQPLSVDIETWDHKAYYPRATPLFIRITGDIRTGKLLGAQMMGQYQAEVAKRIDIFAAALHSGMEVEGLNDLDLSYTPPLSSPWDPVQMAAQAWSRSASEKVIAF